MVNLENTYQNGDIIETRPHSYPLVSHFGIIIFLNGAWWVLHNIQSKGVTEELLTEVLKRHTLIAVRHSEITGMSAETIYNKYLKYRGLKYDMQFFNCESFVNLMINDTVISWEYWGYVVLFTIVVFFVLYQVYQLVK